MTPLKHTPELPNEGPGDVPPEHVVDTATTREKLNRLVPEMQQGEGVQAVESDLQQPLPQPTPATPELSPDSVNDKLYRKLDQLGDLASNLADLNTEHRVKDFRDGIPIWANFRSHNLATKEGETITDIKRIFAEVQQLVRDYDRQLDLKEIETIVNKIQAPAGASKLAASVFMFPRAMHRSFFVTRAENLRQAVQNVRNTL